jgi:phosphopantothenoylcysteine decarboxylase/phosphopantothenate--cysteine ligase
MGFALAREAERRGAEVTLIAANTSLEPPRGAEVIEVETAAELERACEQQFDACDVLLMAAAVADFRPSAPADHKLKKTNPPTPPAPIALEQTTDVIAALAARRRPGQVLVGFAAEHGTGAVDYGRSKLERKRLDAVVVNDISEPGIGFDASDNEVVILSSDGITTEVPRTAKARVAGAVLDEVERLMLKKERDGATGASTRSPARV